MDNPKFIVSDQNEKSITSKNNTRIALVSPLYTNGISIQRANQSYPSVLLG